MNCIIFPSVRPPLNWCLAALVVGTAGRLLAAPATGPLSDRNTTLAELDAQFVRNPSQGAHFAGARAMSILDATFSAYFYSGGGNYRYLSIRPAVPLIEVGMGQQVATEHNDTGGISTGFIGSFPTDGGGKVNVGAAHSADTSAQAALATGILRNSSKFQLEGPTVSKTPAHPYDGFAVQGSATSRSEIADYITTSKATTLNLSGIWEGSITANPPGSIVPTAINAPSVLATGPNLVQVIVHMEISIWSAPRTVHHPGDGETGGSFSFERTYLGGVTFDRQVAAGQTLVVHEPFNAVVPVPAGEFYVYASQSLEAGGGSDASQGLGGSVYVQIAAAADFDHTLQFNLTPDPATGATLASESGEFLKQVAPALGISQAGNQIVLNWPGSSEGYSLQTSNSVLGGGSWSPVTSGITQAGGQFSFSTPLSEAPAFYRLTKN